MIRSDQNEGKNAEKRAKNHTTSQAGKRGVGVIDIETMSRGTCGFVFLR